MTSPTSVYELAGMVDDAGRIGRALPEGSLVVPHPLSIAVIGEFVLWSDSGIGGLMPWRPKRPGAGMLNEFVAIADDSARLRPFVKKWGPLRLCPDHSLPYGHRPVEGQERAFCGSAREWMGFDAALSALSVSLDDFRTTVQELPDARRFYGVRQETDIYREPVSAWMPLAREAQAVLNLTAAFRNDSLGDDRDWQLVGVVPAPTTKRVAIHMLSQVVNRWLADGSARPWLRWSDTGPTMFFAGGNELLYGGGGLLGALALQLALAVAGPGLFQCAVCGEWRTGDGRKRRPARGKRFFCRDCADAKGNAYKMVSKRHP